MPFKIRSFVFAQFQFGACPRIIPVIIVAIALLFGPGSHQLVLAQDAGGAAASPEAAPPQETLLQFLYNALGWFYIVIFLTLSFILVALFIMNILSARRDSVCPQHLIDGFEAHLDEKRYQEAYELAKTDESFLGNVLSAGLAKLSNSYAHATEAMQQVGEDENMKLEHRLSYMALIGTISPMVGLFGTVDGMIRAFYTIYSSGTTPPANKLALAVSTALLTTLIGLAIAIPAIAAYNILRNRVQRLVLEVGIISENLMSRFEKVGTKKE
jgi:biopolymer transport protein ExbB